MAADDDPSGTVAAPAAKPAAVLRRPASQVADAKGAREAAAAKMAATELSAATLPLNASAIATGDVLWVNIPNSQVMGGEQAKNRPWLVISHKRRAHRSDLNLVIAVPLTRKVDKVGKFREARIMVPVEFIRSTDERFERVPCLALTEHVRAIAVERTDGKVGEIDASVVSSCRGAIGFLIGLTYEPKSGSR